MNKIIEQINVREILPLRQRILRPGKSLSESTFNGDNTSGTFHLALKENKKIQAVASFMPQALAVFSQKNQYRLRGMAVAKKQQGKGLGSQLLQAGIDVLISRNCSLLWFNARIEAVQFYSKHQFKIRGEAFEISEVGPHHLMFKEL